MSLQTKLREQKSWSARKDGKNIKRNHLNYLNNFNSDLENIHKVSKKKKILSDYLDSSGDPFGGTMSSQQFGLLYNKSVNHYLADVQDINLGEVIRMRKLYNKALKYHHKEKTIFKHGNSKNSIFYTIETYPNDCKVVNAVHRMWKANSMGSKRDVKNHWKKIKKGWVYDKDKLIELENFLTKQNIIF